MHPVIDLSGKKIFISGASSGIGKEASVLADKLGADLFLSGRDEKRLHETLSILTGKNHQTFLSDLRDEKNLATLSESLPPLDGIVHCAGVVKPFPVKFIQQRHIDEVFKINFYSPVILTAQLLKLKKINKEASLVFISSVSSGHPYPGGALYSSSKSALEAYCKTMALEYASQKIRANIISPALVKTAIFSETEAASSKEELNKYEKNYPLGFGKPEDIANTIVFLLSGASGWITGQNIIMDGGLLLGTR